MNDFEEIVKNIGNALSDYALIPLLLAVAIMMTLATRGVQFRMFGEMIRLLFARRSAGHGSNSLSSFQAFIVSVASHVGTGNLAGVATAITLGGPGAVFWMWMIAILGAATSFVENTLAQLFKARDGQGGFRGGPAYYISRGIGSKTWAITFAVLISVTFGFAYNSVQSNTIAEAFSMSWGIDTSITAVCITALTIVIIWGGIRSIARFSEWVVPIMAVAYILVGIIIVVMNIESIPAVFRAIIDGAFGLDQAVGGTMGAALAMGIRRGLFSNEAGEGSAPNAGATADVTHPAKQGLVQALGVYFDTIVICTFTALIILLSGVPITDTEGITLTQRAIGSEFDSMGFGATFVSLAIFFFAFTSIVANYYYGETNIRFMSRRPGWVIGYRLAVGAMVLIGGLSSLDLVWSLADITMALMAICNLGAVVILGRYAFRSLRDYCEQRRQGRDPVYYRDINPEIAELTECWPSRRKDEDNDKTPGR